MTSRATFLLFWPLALALGGCRQSSSLSAPARDHHPAPLTPASEAGGVSGVISFTGKAPPRIGLNVSADPGCYQANLPVYTEQVVVSHHRLANVYVYVKSGAPNGLVAAGAPPVVLDQRGCSYIPHVVAVQQGGSVEFVNSDATVHNITTVPTQAGNPSANFSEPANSAPRTETFKTPEVMIPVRCSYHPWMSAFINVAPNPWFDVTGSDGAFHITDLPEGRYTLAAVQEKLGEQDVQITVTRGAVSTANFNFSAR